MTPSDHVIETGKDGTLFGTTTEEHIDAIVDRIAAAPQVALHFHGGLVSRENGLLIADKLLPVYKAANCDPVFFVWHSGFLEVLKNNLNEILAEDLMRKVLVKTAKFVLGKFNQDSGSRAMGIITPERESVVCQHHFPVALEPKAAESKPRDAGKPPGLTELTDEEARVIEDELHEDLELMRAIDDVLAGHLPADVLIGSRSTGRTRASTTSLVDPDVLAELAPDQGVRSVTTMLLVAKKCVAIITRAIKRFVDDNDHGLYPTVLEECLREFYFANVGGAVWAAMKKETEDTFVPDLPGRGGRYFLDKLAGRVRAGARPQITLIGHSTGSVFIGNFLRAVTRLREPWPADAAFRVVFEAPSTTYRHFGETLDVAAPLIKEFLMFTMDDEHEQADRLLGALYPHSLLYLVSGLLERDRNGDSGVEPLVGLARYLRPVPTDIKPAAPYLSELDRTVYSPSPPEAPVGRRSTADGHTEFDDDPVLLASLTTFLARS
ncbi:hypothetical protein AB0C24_14080 [Amycolatopsis japonica]|uniref:hypothetical protein n=1 Tax=Amycolatopsis japonica TaxID=208439 RepID=UPI0033E15E2E